MKAVIYTRVSSKEQERDGFSIPAQRKLLREYARSKKIEIIKEFSDVETAKSAGRTQFGKMIEYLSSNHEVKTLLVEKTDRLYRNFRDYVTIEDLDIAIHLVKENEIISKDSRSHAKLVHGVKVLLAKNYIDNLSEEVRKGMTEKAEQGNFPGKSPIGYINDKSTKTILVDSNYSKMIRRIYELYSTGNYSLQRVRKVICDERWLTPTNRKFAKSMIESILKNPFYFGDFLWKGERYQGSHPAIIPIEMYNKVQNVLHKGHSTRVRRHNLLLKGILQCDQCGCSIVGEIKKQKYVYYHCTQAKGKCEQGWVREEQLDKSMGEVLKAIQINDSTMADIVRALRDGSKEERVYRLSEQKRLERRIRDLQNKLDKAYEDRLDGVIDDRYWKDISTKWRGEQDNLSNNLSRLKDANRDYIDQAIEILELSKTAYSQYLRQDDSQKRKLLQSVLSNCTLKGTTLYPTYRKPFNYIAEGLKTQFKLPRLDSNQRPAD